MLHKIYSALKSDKINYKGIILPAGALRSGGKEFEDDEYYLQAARIEADKLITHTGLTEKSSVLDFGCGTGILALGISQRIGDIRNYSGVDVNKKVIEWCAKYITKQHPAFRFYYMEGSSENHNPSGALTENTFRLPFNDKRFNIIYLYSVFSLMIKEEVVFYLNEFKRTIKKDGRVFLTAFVEENVPEISINAEGSKKEWKGPLHCVRYDKDYFEELLTNEGFAVEAYESEMESDGQSAYYLRFTGI